MFTSLKAKMLSVLVGFLALTCFLFYLFLYQEITVSLNHLGLDSAKQMLSFSILNLESKCKGIAYYKELCFQQQRDVIKHMVHNQKQNIITIHNQLTGQSLSKKQAKQLLLNHINEFRYGQKIFFGFPI
ncbi:MAG: hypothetical protein OMM_07909 [Candidatus Magnetoglobus multicellularis str. Araruama]|uniref:Uncharacterized protein n=1 Tax=Candidatus Magnetoglobus multicellularis str. Araruama TaxID=890399 RepID=A0A1V1PAA2_9BACT|nr:MAG: hypothetical protein OMM_07909 [Candidatus Magnetoglobus multicellularis str. Araruama]